MISICICLQPCPAVRKDNRSIPASSFCAPANIRHNCKRRAPRFCRRAQAGVQSSPDCNRVHWAGWKQWSGSRGRSFHASGSPCAARHWALSHLIWGVFPSWWMGRDICRCRKTFSVPPIWQEFARTMAQYGFFAFSCAPPECAIRRLQGQTRPMSRTAVLLVAQITGARVSGRIQAGNSPHNHLWPQGAGRLFPFPEQPPGGSPCAASMRHAVRLWYCALPCPESRHNGKPSV